MLAAIRCPSCQKYQFVEPVDRGKAVPCLICKQPIRIPAAPPAPSVAAVRLPPMHDVKLEL
jgi:hypothetical protein